MLGLKFIIHETLTGYFPLPTPHTVISSSYELCSWYLSRIIKNGQKGAFFRNPVLESSGELHPTGIGETSSLRSVGVRGCSNSRFGL